jgi:hypothetical protein
MISLAKPFRIIKIILFLSVLFSLHPSEVRGDVSCNEGNPPEVNGKIAKGDFLNLLKCLDSYTKGEPPNLMVEEVDDKYYLQQIGWV